MFFKSASNGLNYMILKNPLKGNYLINFRDNRNFFVKLLREIEKRNISAENSRIFS